MVQSYLKSTCFKGVKTLDSLGKVEEFGLSQKASTISRQEGHLSCKGAQVAMLRMHFMLYFFDTMLAINR